MDEIDHDIKESKITQLKMEFQHFIINYPELFSIQRLYDEVNVLVGHINKMFTDRFE